MGIDIRDYLQDPFINRLYDDIKRAGPIRAISVDITHKCNIRCQGCYFFAEDMDKNKSPQSEDEFDAFIEREKSRGTNFVTVIGGEPSLVLGRLKKLSDNFRVTVITNGLRKIPYDGFENLSIGVSVWGGHETDKRLRGNGKTDVFAKALENYRDDNRVGWYYTTVPSYAYEIESVVEKCVGNGNYVSFNFYGDISHKGGDLSHLHGFEQVLHEINQMINRHPEKILITSYMSKVVATGMLYNEKWGYDVCSSITFDNEMNRERIANGKPYNPHFRAYNPDLASTRRCCVGEARDCSNCFDVWAHYSWIMMNMKCHSRSKQEFTNWLTTVYLFYIMNGGIDINEAVKLLPEIHKRASN